MKKTYQSPVSENIEISAQGIMQNISGGNGNSGQDENGGVGARTGFLFASDSDSDFNSDNVWGQSSLWDD